MAGRNKLVAVISHNGQQLAVLVGGSEVTAKSLVSNYSTLKSKGWAKFTQSLLSKMTCVFLYSKNGAPAGAVFILHNACYFHELMSVLLR